MVKPRIIAAAICSPLIAAFAAAFSSYVLTRGYIDASLFKFASIFSSVWFVVFFAPIAFILLRAQQATLFRLICAGAATGAIFLVGVLFLLLSMMGHGGTHMNVGAFLGEGALLGAMVGTVVGISFNIIAGITIRSSGPLR